MAAQLRAEFTDRGLKLAGGEELELFAGSMHYWRIERRHWRACLEGIQRLGFGIVETYVPWSVHETSPGRWDFTGNRDLGAFLELAGAIGLRAIVRPGPHINAELTGWGYPARILRDPEIQARTARGTTVTMPAPPRMFPVPSYASRKFQAAAGEWLKAAGEIVAAHPSVVAAQVDNEMQMFFRIGAYDSDYHPDALAWWRESAGGAEAPRAWDPAKLETCLRWVAFKDEYAARSLRWVAEAMRAGGFGDLPLFHNSPPSEPEYLDLPAAEQALGEGGVVGMDFYHRRGDYARYRRRAMYLTGTARLLPIAPEVGLGGPLWLPPMSPGDQEDVLRGLLMCGVRGFIFFMTVLRDRWYGSPLDGEGREQPTAAFVKRLLATLREVSWTRLRRRAEIALVLPSNYVRLATASSLADPVSPILIDFRSLLGPAGAAELARDDRARRHRLLVRACMAALDAARAPYDLVDEKLSAERLARYRTVVVPTLDMIDRALLRTLGELSRRGVEVRLGPERPSLDEWGRPLGADAGVLPVAPELSLDFASPLTFVAAEKRIDTAVYVDEGGSPRVFFVASQATRRVTTELAIPAGVMLEDCFLGGPKTPGAMTLSLDPGEVRMFRVS